MYHCIIVESCDASERKKTMSLIKEVLRGMVIGVANIIPGVSGGTMAVSMGIYDKMIYAINHIRTEFKKSVLTLLPYVIGMGVGIVVLSFVISFLFEEYPYQTSMGFIGLILGGVPAIWNRVKGKKRGVGHYIVLLLFLAGIILLEVLGGGKENVVDLEPGLVMAGILFVIGIIASATMVIPGVSGSMILMLLGFYTPILEEIKHFIRSGLALDMQEIWSSVAILLPFGLGIIVGIVLIAKLIGYLLEHAETYTYMGILGLVFASPVVVFLQMQMGSIGFLGGLVGVLCLALGALVAARLSD